MKTKKLYLIGLTAFVVVIMAVVAVCCFYPINKTGKTECLYVDSDDDIDSVATKMSTVCNGCGVSTVRTLARHTG